MAESNRRLYDAGPRATTPEPIVRESAGSIPNVNQSVSQAMSATEFLLLLHSVPQLGEKALGRLLRLNAQGRIRPETCLGLSAAQWKREYELHPQAAAYLEAEREPLLARSRELARTLRAYNVSLLTLESATYPARLERNDDAPPPLLYTLGNRALLDPPRPPKPDASAHFTFTIAVSNGATPEILARQDALASELVRQGGVPITGHDRSAYQRLALAAQRQNKPTCYVLDRGLREVLGPDFARPPFAAARIRDAVFGPARDLALSPFRLDDHGIAANNRRRDRLVFALSDVIIALDVRAGGGMFGECLRAWNGKRAVWTVEGGRDGNEGLRSAGCPILPDAPDWTKLLSPIFATS